MTIAKTRPQPSKGLALIEPAEQVLYNDCDPGQASELSRGMVPHACAAFQTKSTAPAWADQGFERRRAYIRTLDDFCNPAFVQDLWRERMGVHWDVAEMKTGHMPFISQPQELALEIVKFVKGFMAM